MVEGELDRQGAPPTRYTPLIVAVRGGDLAAVKALIAAGASLEAGDVLNGRPLHHAAIRGDYEIAKELLAAGARVDAADDHNSTPLVHLSLHADASGPEDALHTEHYVIAAMLIEAGADVDHLAGNGQGALHNACANGALDVIGLLIDSGATVDLLSRDNATPLHFASEYEQAEAVKILLAAGADPQLRDNLGRTALR